MCSLFLHVLIALLFLLSSTYGVLNAQEKQEETYSISLIQAAEPGNTTVTEIDGRKVPIERYEVQSGDHLWKILREKGLLKKQVLQEVLRNLKRLNPSLIQLDLLHPGETIVIPLIITPSTAGAQKPKHTQEPPAPLENFREDEVEYYTIQPGDSLVKIIKSKFNLSKSEIHDEFLNLLKKMNPSCENLNLVFPGQKIRLPIYSAQVIRSPVPPPPPPEGDTGSSKEKEEVSLLKVQIASIFKEMGLDWIEAGQHFIPLKSGGQINLSAESFPIINLPSGIRVILDFGKALPDRMANLITSHWENYKVVRVEKEESLRKAVGKLIAACKFREVYGSSEVLEIPGDTVLRLKADWIIRAAGESPTRSDRVCSIILLDSSTPRTPKSLKKMFEEMGVRLIEYPILDPSPEVNFPETNTLDGGSSTRELVENLLRLTGTTFSKEVEIPVYRSGKSEYNLIIKADFLVNVDGAECIIDFAGLEPEIVSFLKDHHFRVLSLGEADDPLTVTTRVLGFLLIPFDPSPHQFLAAERDPSKNVSMMVDGIVFSDKDDKKILAPARTLAAPLLQFLSGKGYRILKIPPSSR